MDSIFLYAESENMPLHMMGALVLSASDGGPVEDYRRIRAHLEPRLRTIPMLRRKLQEVPLWLDRPMWVDDDRFEIDHHLRRAAVPSPGGDRELADFVARFAEVPLRRDRPLWEMYIVEGLSNRRFAIVSKIHHAVADGIGCARLLGALLDTDPQPREIEDSGDPTPVTRRAPWSLLCEAGLTLAATPMRSLRQLARSSGAGLRLLGSVLEQRGAPSAPRTPLNRRVSGRRAVAMGRVSFGDVERVKRAEGATVNHVILAACAGALRQYLRDHGGTPEQPLVTAVPVALGGRAADGMGNAVSAMLVELPVHLPDPRARLRAVREASLAARATQKALANQLGEWADLVPPALVAGAARLYGRLGAAEWHRPLQHVIISNVPGPQVPLYCAGARVHACHPFGPVYDGCALNLTVMSYDGGVGLGAIACPEAVPDLESIPQAFEAAMEELVRGCMPSGGAVVPLRRCDGPEKPVIRTETRANR